jgi:phosphoribosylglycinamide formyltransferase
MLGGMSKLKVSVITPAKLDDVLPILFLMKRILVLISGSGTNLQALVDAFETSKDARVVGVLSNRANAYGLTRAKQHNIPTHTLSLKAWLKAHPDQTRDAYDTELAEWVMGQMPDVVVLAGFMHILSQTFIDRMHTVPVINLHPALPGELDGLHAIERAYDEWKEGKRTTTGVMVHRVVAQVDRGEVIVQQPIEFVQGESLNEFTDRVHALEHVLIVQGTKRILGVY